MDMPRAARPRSARRFWVLAALAISTAVGLLRTASSIWSW